MNGTDELDGASQTATCVSSRPRLLVVEDEAAIVAPLVEGLERSGFDVTVARTGGEALRSTEEIDLVLLDLGLPDIDGVDVCRTLRARGDTPIIVLTARGAELERVLLLELGADDYVVKPFGFRELVARMHAVLRRSLARMEAGTADQPQEIGPLTLDRRSRRVSVSGTEVTLTPKEFDLLAKLAEDAGAVVRRQRLIEEVWDEHWWGPTKTLDVHIASLRKKLGHPDWITTVRGVGYRFDAAMTRRLLVTYLTITLFGLALFGIPLGLTFAHRERDRLLFEIERDADTIAATVQAPRQSNSALPAAQILAYATRTGGRVIVVDTAGSSIFDTDAPEGPPIDFSSRPEIQQALGGNRVDGSRYSNTVGTHLLYVAVPTNDDGRVNGAVRITYPTATLDARVRRVWAQMTLLGLAVLVAVTIAAFLVARSITRPVRRLEEATDRLASGELEMRADEAYGPQELRHLAATFNRMATRVTSVLDAEKRFVADASHQLRTPLTALRLRLENLETTASDAERPAIDAAIAEVNRLGRLVDGLLTLERGDSETSAPVPVDVAEVVRNRADAWRELVSARGVALAVETPGRARALAIPGAVEQLVDNLLDNALDVSRSGETVIVRIVRSVSGIELHVVDEGPGLDADARRRAFDRFWRGPEASEAGSGLGLAIVRRLAEASGGSARLDAASSGGIDAVAVLPEAPASGDVATGADAFAMP